LTRKDSELAFKKIKESNYEVHLQSKDSIIEDILKFKPSVVINDILDTEEKYIKELKDNGISVINFEDLGKGAEYADLVVNAMYPENKVVLDHYYGSKYFILRDEFLYTNKVAINEKLSNILVSFGGVDPNNYTERVLELIIKKYGQKFNISVVTGLGYKYSEEIQKKYPSVEVKVNIKNISDEMAKSDLVITSAGRTTFEVASLGIPCIVLCQNKRETTHFFASEKNGFYNLGLGYEANDDQIMEALDKVIDYNIRLLMSNRMIENNIKKGKERVLSLINETILA
jgi:spore coat polysaccharide biosynthesis predicted glycosyltransferase SpsG